MWIHYLGHLRVGNNLIDWYQHEAGDIVYRVDGREFTRVNELLPKEVIISLIPKLKKIEKKKQKRIKKLTTEQRKKLKEIDEKLREMGYP